MTTTVTGDKFYMILGFNLEGNSVVLDQSQLGPPCDNGIFPFVKFAGF